MKFPKLSLTGDLGSGKSAVSRILSEKLGYRIVSTGGIQRAIAEKHGMTTLELNEYTRTHPEIDDEIDGTVTSLGQSDESIIFDSRLAWHFAPASFKVYLLVDTYVAAARIFGDQRTSEAYQDVEEARQKILARRQSELDRFRDYYKIDYADLRNFDLVVDTTQAAPEEVATCILQAFDHWQNGKTYAAFHLCPRNLYPTRLVCCSLDKDKADIRVLKSDRNFLILNGHSPVATAIAANRPLVAATCVFEGYEDLLKQLSTNMLKQWEDLNFVRFREYPEIYDDTRNS